MTAKRFVFLGTAILAFALGSPVTFAAFGVSPPFINASHLVAGATYTQTIYLVQDNPSSAESIQATLDVPSSIQSWVTLSPSSPFTIPAGVQQFPVNVTIQVPQGAGLGAYQGSLLFATQPSSAGQVTIALGANVNLNLTVGTGIYEQYSIPYIQFPDIEEGWNPRVTYRLQNSGNVSEQLTGATLALYDQYDAAQLAYLTVNTGFPVIPAFTTQENTIQFPTDFHLGVGTYWGVVTFYKNNQQVASQKAIINVLPRGALSSPFDLVIENIESYWIYYLVILIAIILVVRRIWIVRRSKKRTRS